MKKEITTSQVYHVEDRTFTTKQRAEAFVAHCEKPWKDYKKQVASLADELEEITEFDSGDIRQVLYELMKMGCTLPPALEQTT